MKLEKIITPFVVFGFANCGGMNQESLASSGLRANVSQIEYVISEEKDRFDLKKREAIDNMKDGKNTFMTLLGDIFPSVDYTKPLEEKEKESENESDNKEKRKSIAHFFGYNLSHNSYLLQTSDFDFNKNGSWNRGANNYDLFLYDGIVSGEYCGYVGMNFVTLPMPVDYVPVKATLVDEKNKIERKLMIFKSEGSFFVTSPVKGLLCYEISRVNDRKIDFDDNDDDVPFKINYSQNVVEKLEGFKNEFEKKGNKLEMVKGIEKFVEDHISYTVNEDVDRLYKIVKKDGFNSSSKLREAWLRVSDENSFERYSKSEPNLVNFVMNLRHGDCDVKNTAFVAILRDFYGLKAKIAYGKSCKGGECEEISNINHGWALYFDGEKIVTLDST
jgi:hypothetical protein